MGLGHVRGLYWLQHVGSICSYCGVDGWTTLMRRVETQIKRGDQRRLLSNTGCLASETEYRGASGETEYQVDQVGNTKVLQNIKESSSSATVETEGRADEQ